MPGPFTIFSLGAAGAAGAAVYVNRRNSMTNSDATDSDKPLSPIALARRRSSNVSSDHDWNERKQAEYFWRRDTGVSFSHNSEPKYPTGQLQQKSIPDLQQTSTTK